MKSLLQKIIDFNLLAILVVFPISVGMSLVVPEDIDHPVVAMNISFADILIGISFLLMILKVLIFKEWKELCFPTISIVFFVFVNLISFVNATSLINWLKETLQVVEYFVLFYFLLLNNLKSFSRKFLVATIYIFTSFSLILAFIQHTVLGADIYLVRGFFENRNYFGAYLCMSIPIIYFESLHTQNILLRIFSFILLGFSIWLLTTGGAVIALIIGLGFISWKSGKKILIGYTATILFVVVVYPYIFPRKNLISFNSFFSIYEQGSVSENYYRRLTILEDKNSNTLIYSKVGEYYFIVTLEDYLKRSFSEIQNGNRYKKLENDKNIKNRYLEMQASINLISDNALLGIGSGNYQNHIGSYFNKFPKINTAEPGQNNGYLIIGATTGFLGLFALVWLFYDMFSCLKKKHTDDFIRIGVCGTVIACIIVNSLVYLFTSNLIVPFILLMYFSLNPKEDAILASN